MKDCANIGVFILLIFLQQREHFPFSQAGKLGHSDAHCQHLIPSKCLALVPKFSFPRQKELAEAGNFILFPLLISESETVH